MAAGEKCEGMQERIAEPATVRVVDTSKVQAQNDGAVEEARMRVFAMAVAGLIIAAGAQQGRANAAQFSRYAAGAGCPGALWAQRQPGGGATVWTVAQEDRNRDRQTQGMKGSGVHVEFNTPNKSVQMLELTVNYVPAGVRVKPVAPGTDATISKESKKTFVLQQESSRRVDADLLIGPAATITRVHVVSATFSDGSGWRAPSEDVCSVGPVLYMPVAANKK